MVKYDIVILKVTKYSVNINGGNGMKKRILIIAAALLLSVNSVFAQNSIDTDNSVSVSEKSNVFKIDNSDLQVDVFQYTDGNAETIYSGLLGGYAGRRRI